MQLFKLLAVIILAVGWVGLVTPVLAVEQLIYPQPVPDSRTVSRPEIHAGQWCNHYGTVNPGPQNILYNSQSYMQTQYCGFAQALMADSTSPAGTVHVTVVGQVITIPAGINRLTSIFFDDIKVRNESGGENSNYQGEIRVYGGGVRDAQANANIAQDNPTRLIGKVSSTISGGLAQAVFSPALAVTPGNNVYFEFYGLSPLNEHNIVVPVHATANNWTNNSSTHSVIDAYPAGQGYRTGGDGYYNLTGLDSGDLAKVRVYGEGGNSSSCVSYSYPTGPLQVGKEYPTVIAMKNTGNTTWKSADLYRLGSVETGNNSTPWWTYNRISLPSDTQTVAPGNTATFNFNIIPTTSGDHEFSWQMLQENVEWFNTQCPAQTIRVTNFQAPNPPVDLKATCNPTGTQVTLSWEDLGVTSYRLRLDKSPDSFNAVSAKPGYNCSGTVASGDICKDDAAPQITTNSYIAPIAPGVKYKFWVHSVGADGGVSDPSVKYTGNTADGNVPSPEGFQCAGGEFDLQAETGIACGQSSLISWGASTGKADSVKVRYAPYNGYDPTASLTPQSPDAPYIVLSASALSGTYPLYIPGPATTTWTVEAIATKAGQSPISKTVQINCESAGTAQSSVLFHKTAPRNTLTPAIFRDNVQMKWEAYAPPSGQPAGIYHVIACPVSTAATAIKCAGGRTVDEWTTGTAYPATFGTAIGLTFDTAYYWQVYWAPQRGFDAVAYYTEEGWVDLAQSLDQQVLGVSTKLPVFWQQVKQFIYQLRDK